MALPDFITGDEICEPLFDPFFIDNGNSPKDEGVIHDNTMNNPHLIELGIHPRPNEVRKPVRAYLEKGPELGKIYYRAGNKIDNLTDLGPKDLRLFMLGNVHHYCTTVDSWLTLMDICSWFATQDVPERQVIIMMLDELVTAGYLRTKTVVIDDVSGRERTLYSSTSWLRNALPRDRLFKEYYTDIRSLQEEREILQFLDKLTKRKGLKIKPLHGDVLYYMILCAVWVQMKTTPADYYVRTSDQVVTALGLNPPIVRQILFELYQFGLLDRSRPNGKEYVYGVDTNLFAESDAPAILKEITFDFTESAAYRLRYGNLCEMPSQLFLLGKVDNEELEKNV